MQLFIRCSGTLNIPAGETVCFHFVKEAIFDKDGTRNECTESYFNIVEKEGGAEKGFKVCNGGGKAFMVCSKPGGVSGDRTIDVELVAANEEMNWQEMFYLYIGLCMLYSTKRL